MREIRDRISTLTDSYERQLQLYQQIQSLGTQEEELIAEARLDQLLELLKQKESLLKEVGLEETTIKASQDFLARHFNLEEFSIPKLKAGASERYQEGLSALGEMVEGLLPVLESLEEQERKNEGRLRHYLEVTQDPNTDGTQKKRAQEAYKRDKT